jgi:hypothetical protein
MVSPSLYNVRVNASTPFMLVLSETYNPLWQASGPQGTIPGNSHFVVNGYANMWYVTQTGVYTLQLHFLPDNYVSYGTTIAQLTLILTFFIVYRRSVRRFASKVSYLSLRFVYGRKHKATILKVSEK